MHRCKFDVSHCLQIANTTKRNDVIKMFLETIEFANVDEIVEMIEFRFANANIEFDDNDRDVIRYAYENCELKFNVDSFHAQIENNVRLRIANNVFYTYCENNEYSVCALIANDMTFHIFDVIDVETMRTIKQIFVNDNLFVELFDV